MQLSPASMDTTAVSTEADDPKMTRAAISEAMREFLLKRDCYTCQYCLCTAETAELQIDHIHPVSAGGNNDPDNLLVACWPCNIKKGAGTMPEHLRVRLMRDVSARRKGYENDDERMWRNEAAYESRTEDPSYPIKLELPLGFAQLRSVRFGAKFVYSRLKGSTGSLHSERWDDLIEIADTFGIDRSDIFGYIMELQDGGFIKGFRQEGTNRPYWKLLYHPCLGKKTHKLLKELSIGVPN